MSIEELTFEAFKQGREESAAEIERLRGSVMSGLEILGSPEFGTYDYMEGVSFYQECDAWVREARAALQRKEG
jgi:hypothetical protein